MNHFRIHSATFLLSLLMMIGMGSPVMSWAKKKKVATVSATQADRLSYADRQRYNYIFLEAVRQRNAGHDAAAFDLLRRCLMIDPDAAEVYFMQSNYWGQLRQDSMALASLEKAALLRPENDTYQERLAQSYIGTGNYAKATEVYERLAALHRDRSDVLNILVQLYKQQKDYDRMLDAINRLARVEGEDEQFALARMSVYELKGDSKNAYRTLKELADSHPNDLSFTIMLGNWLMHNHRQKEAYVLFGRALKAEPDNAYAQSSMYDYYRAAGQDTLAHQMMERILLSKNTPTDNRMQFLRQAIQENEGKDGDSTQIISLIDRIQQVMPRDAAVAEMKVAYYTLKKMPEEEINKALVELLQLAPDNGGARFQLIQNKWAQEDWKAVAELSEPGMLYNPDEMAFYYFTGLARYYQKDDNGALDALQRGTAEINTKSDPKIVSDFYAIMGEIYHNQGNRAKAYAAYDSCLQWKPDHYMTLNNYAYYLSIEGGNLKKAEEMSARTIKAEPKNSTFLDTYAWILYKQNRFAEAKIYIDQALKNDTDSLFNADVLEHAGDIYVKAGDAAGALNYWQKAIDAGGDAGALEKKIRLYRKEK
ncbi:MAG: tetratricopeptide repeat protein [Prevotella sp.]|nr:tetratricopeptide repeat protein [Prevotella sp.]